MRGCAGLDAYARSQCAMGSARVFHRGAHSRGAVLRRARARIATRMRVPSALWAQRGSSTGTQGAGSRGAGFAFQRGAGRRGTKVRSRGREVMGREFAVREDGPARASRILCKPVLEV